MAKPVKALLDANVLYSNHLRNLLLQLAQNDVFDARWSERIEQEWLGAMEPRTRERIATRTIPLIRTWFADALVSRMWRAPRRHFRSRIGKNWHGSRTF